MGLLYRLFKVGKMPDAIRSEIARESVLYEAEGIRVALHRRGRVPGAVVAGGGVSVGLGSLAVTDQRIIGSRGRSKLVDAPYEAKAEGPVAITLDEHGLHVVFDLDKVHPSCSGEMKLDFRQELSGEDLSRFPMREMSIAVDPQKVVRLFGSLKKLPEEGSSSS
ncbi:MAG: hypothetical protein ABR579_03270 [Actinomycetota bacterium]